MKTGLHRRAPPGQQGLLRQAHGGVLFLDEIGDMPLVLQSRLLRVLQEREVSPLGGARPVPVDFALLCATHRPLAHEGADAPVRPDLYFRIAEYTVTLLLRERTDLREPLRTLWNAQGAVTALPPVVERALASYAWPGNYRQLVSVLRTLRVLAGPSGVAGLSMLPEEIQRVDAAACAAPARGGVAAQPAGFADAAIREALAAHGGNVSRAARVLGVHRSTLYRRVAALEAARPNGRRLPDQARWRSGAGDQRISRASSAPGSGARMKASPTRKASTLCWRIS